MSSELSEALWNEIEQAAGAPFVKPVDQAGVEARRREVYLSYEKFLRERLAALDRQREGQWRRDYSSIAAYEASIEPMRRKLCAMLGFWVEPSERAALNVSRREKLLDEKDFSASRFNLEVLPGLLTYGIELTPKRSLPT